MKIIKKNEFGKKKPELYFLLSTCRVHKDAGKCSKSDEG